MQPCLLLGPTVQMQKLRAERSQGPARSHGLGRGAREEPELTPASMSFWSGLHPQGCVTRSKAHDLSGPLLGIPGG